MFLSPHSLPPHQSARDSTKAPYNPCKEKRRLLPDSVPHSRNLHLRWPVAYLSLLSPCWLASRLCLLFLLVTFAALGALLPPTLPRDGNCSSGLWRQVWWLEKAKGKQGQSLPPVRNPKLWLRCWLVHTASLPARIHQTRRKPREELPFPQLRLVKIPYSSFALHPSSSIPPDTLACLAGQGG